MSFNKCICGNRLKALNVSSEDRYDPEGIRDNYYCSRCEQTFGMTKSCLVPIGKQTTAFYKANKRHSEMHSLAVEWRIKLSRLASGPGCLSNEEIVRLGKRLNWKRKAKSA